MAATGLGGQWVLVETMGEEPTVIGVGARLRDMRRLTNMFRGAAKSTVDALIEQATAKREPDTRRIPASATDQLGGPFGLAVPTVGPVGNVVAVQLWFGRPESEPEPPPTLGCGNGRWVSKTGHRDCS